MANAHLGNKKVFNATWYHKSGWSLGALERLPELSSRLSYEQSSHLAKRFGLEIGSSSLERLTSGYAQTCIVLEMFLQNKKPDLSLAEYKKE